MARNHPVRFEHRHEHNWAFLKKFYWHTLAAAPVYVVLWGGLTAAGLALAVQSVCEGSVGMTIGCGAAAFLCFLRGFLLGWIRLRKGFREVASLYGKDSWESVMRFYDDSIEMEDDGQASAKVIWANCLRLEDQGTWLRLIFRNNTGELYLRKQDFTTGTAEELQAWLAEEHPELQQKRKA